MSLQLLSLRTLVHRLCPALSDGPLYYKKSYAGLPDKPMEPICCLIGSSTPFLSKLSRDSEQVVASNCARPTLQFIGKADKVSGVLSLLFRSPVGPNSGLKSEPTHHFIRPCLLSKRTPALDRATQVRQFGFGLHTVDERQPASGPLLRPIRQPRFVHGLGHPATIQA